RRVSDTAPEAGRCRGEQEGDCFHDAPCCTLLTRGSITISRPWQSRRNRRATRHAPIPMTNSRAKAPPRRERRKEDRPAEIVAAALAVFAEKGFGAAKITDVAQ